MACWGYIKTKAGSCRDVAVLCMDICRAVGLATRFVSGYQEGDADSKNLDLQAWVKVYLPGAGWRGYDPIQGLVVADRHVALVATPLPQYTTAVVSNFAPVQSSLENGKVAQSQMDIYWSINRI